VKRTGRGKKKEKKKGTHHFKLRVGKGKKEDLHAKDNGRKWERDLNLSPLGEREKRSSFTKRNRGVKKNQRAGD